MREPDYSFDTVVVWRDMVSGTLYWAADSGCSCPTPFEDYNSVDDLNVLYSFDEIRNVVQACYDPLAKSAFLRTIRRYMDDDDY